MKHVKLIGVELEGAWETRPSFFKYDGSVSIPTDKPLHIGEICSTPSTLTETSKWIKKNYPIIVNKTCGFHIHTSFKNIKNYIQLMDSEFYAYFLDTVTDWAKSENLAKSHEFWKRLKGSNTFCGKIWEPEKQLYNGYTRYTQLNFAAYNKHGTIECRLFPAFAEAEVAVSALKSLIDCYETWLASRTMPEFNEEEIVELYESYK